MWSRLGRAVSWFCVLLVLLASTLSLQPPRAFADLRTITIGGGISDWDGVTTTLDDPVDGRPQAEDLVKVWVASDADNLYVRWDAQLAKSTDNVVSTLYGLAFSASGGTTAEAMAWVFFDSSSNMTVAVENASGTKVTLSNANAATANTGTKGGVASVEARFSYSDISSVFPSFNKNGFNALWAETHASSSMNSVIKDKVPDNGYMNYNPTTGGWYPVDPSTPNTAPTINGPGSATVTEDMAKVITLSASDTQQTNLTFTVNSQPAHGSVSAPSNLTCSSSAPYTCTADVTYTPVGNYTGPDSFTFSVSDGSLTAGPATVNLTVSPVNDGPTLTVPGSQNAKQGQPLSFTTTATDPDPGDSLTFAVVAGPGSITSGGVYSWTPSSTAPLGNQTATIRVTDSGLLFDEKMVTITVTERDASLTQSTVTADPTSLPANGTATATVTVQLVGADGGNLTTSHGTVALAITSGAGSLGAVTDNHNGTYTATYTAGTTAGNVVISAKLDGADLTDTATITLGNSAPTLTVGTSHTVKQGATLTFDADATDPEGGALTFSLEGAPAGASINPTTGVVTWTPAATAPLGDVTFTVKVTDSNNGSDSELVTVTVTERDASLSLSTVTASPDSLAANGTATSTVTVQLVGADGGNLTTSHGTVTLAITSGAGSLGAVTDNLDGTYTATYTAGTTAGPVVITAKLNTVALTDTATITLGNSAPTLTVGTSHTVKQGATLTFDADATDPEGGTLTFSLEGAPAGASINPTTGVVTWTPAVTATLGAVTFTVKVTDSNNGSDSELVTVTVTERDADLTKSTVTANPDSLAANGTATSTVTVQLVGADGGNLTQSHGTVTLAIASGSGSLGPVTDNLDGTYTATYTAGTTAGPVVITAKLNTVALTDTATITLGNSAPTLTVGTSHTVKQGATLTFDADATDPEGGTLTFSLVGAPAGASINPTTGVVTWTPAVTAPLGAVTFTVKVTDSNNGSDSELVTVTVTERDADLTKSQVTADPTAIRADGTAKSTITVQLRDSNGVNLITMHGPVDMNTTVGTWVGPVTDKGNGSYTRVLQAGTAVDFATVTATLNGQALTDTAIVAFIANEPPVLTAPATVPGKQNVQATFTATATDPEGDTPLTFTWVSGPGSITPGGVYTWTPDADTTLGDHTVVIRVTDALGAYSEKPVKITVAERDADLTKSQVTAAPDSIRADGNQTSVVTVQLKDSNGVNLTKSHGTVALTTTAGTLVGSVKDNLDGTYTQTLKAGMTAATATISATLGGQALTDTAAITLIANAPPVITAPATVPGKQNVQATFAATATDPEGDTPLIFTRVSGPGSITTGGIYTWTPDANTALGDHTVVIRVTDALGAYAEKSITITVAERDADLTKSQVTADPTAIRANGMAKSTITVQLRDSNGVNLITSHGPVDMTTTAGTWVGPVTDKGNGSYTRVLQAGTAVDFATVKATLNDQALTDTAIVAFIANEPPVLTAPATLPGKQNAQATFTATATDLEGDTPLIFTRVSGPGSITPGGVYTWTPGADTELGEHIVVIRVTDALGAYSEKSITITVAERDADLTKSTVTADPTAVRANGTDTSVITVQLKDSNGVNLTTSHGPVVLTTTAGTWAGTVTDNGNGTYTQTLKAADSAATATISATLNGQALTNTATVAFSEYLGTIRGVVQNTAGSAIDELDITLLDSQGNVVATVKTDANGEYTFPDLEPGTYSIEVRTDDPTRPSATGTATVVAGQVTVVNLTVSSRAELTLTANPLSIVGNGLDVSTLQATLKLKDTAGTPVPELPVTFSTEFGTLSHTSVKTNGDGIATSVLTSAILSGYIPTRKDVKVIARDDKNGIFSEATITITFEPAAISGTVRDDAGNPVVGATVTVDLDGDGEIEANEQVTTGPDGKYKLTVPDVKRVYTTTITKTIIVNNTEIKVTTTQTADVLQTDGGKTVDAGKKISGLVLVNSASGPRRLDKGEEVTGTIVSVGGVPENTAITVNADGIYAIENATPNKKYQILLQLTVGNTKLAGTMVEATVNANGELVIQTPLIDPYGVVRDSRNNSAVSGVRMELYWADTAANIAANRQPHTLVELPPLPNFPPANNAKVQYTDAAGQYAWMVFPNGDYYIKATPDSRFERYDSRNDGRIVGVKDVTDSWVANGIIHVGNTIVEYDINLTPVTDGGGGPSVPGAPTNLTAQGEVGKVALTWNPVAGATSYTVKRALQPGGPYVVIASGVTGTTYADTSVTPGTTYYYVVTAVNSAGEGAPSNQASARPTAPPTPTPTPTPTPPPTPTPTPTPAPAAQSHKRYTMGYPDGTFKPERSITRAEVATILVRVLEAEGLTAGRAPHPDVAAEHWANSYIAIANRLGLMQGDPDGRFRPEDPISRAEVATIAVRFKKLQPKDGIAFPDTAGHWAQGWIKGAFDANLMQGYPDGTFLPRKAITRAEFVTVMNRLLGRGPLTGRPAPRWPDVSTSHWAYKQVEEASVNHEYEPHPILTGERWLKDL